MEKRNYEQEQNRSGEWRAIGIPIGVKLNTVGSSDLSDFVK